MTLVLPQGITGPFSYVISGTTTISWGHNISDQIVSTGIHTSPIFSSSSSSWTIYLRENSGEGLSYINFENWYITSITFQRCNNLRSIDLIDNLLTTISFLETPSVRNINLYETNIDNIYNNILENRLPIIPLLNGILFTSPDYGISQETINIAKSHGWEVILD